MNKNKISHEQSRDSTKKTLNFPWQALALCALLVVLFVLYKPLAKNELTAPSSNKLDPSAEKIVEPHPANNTVQPNKLKLNEQETIKRREHLPSVKIIDETKSNKKPNSVNPQQNTPKKNTMNNIQQLKHSVDLKVEVKNKNTKQLEGNQLNNANLNQGTGISTPETISLAALSEDNKRQQEYQQTLSSTAQPSLQVETKKTRLTALNTEETDTLDEPHTAVNPALLTQESKQATDVQTPLLNCQQQQYLRYYQQQTTANKWLRDNIIALKPKLAQQAHYQYQLVQQQIDDNNTLLSVLFTLSPTQIKTDAHFKDWLPPIDSELRRQLCRYNDLTCQAVIRYSVPTSSLDSKRPLEDSPYQVALNQVVDSDNYRRLTQGLVQTCP